MRAIKPSGRTGKGGVIWREIRVSLDGEGLLFLREIASERKLKRCQVPILATLSAEH